MYDNIFVIDGRYGSGFETTRLEAMTLQNKGVHVISIGTGRNADVAELEAIASYPKGNNALFPFQIGYDRALDLTLKQVDDFLLGKTFFMFLLTLP